MLLQTQCSIILWLICDKEMLIMVQVVTCDNFSEKHDVVSLVSVPLSLCLSLSCRALCGVV